MILLDGSASRILRVWFLLYGIERNSHEKGDGHLWLASKEMELICSGYKL
jgi:hypothetical protein